MPMPEDIQDEIQMDAPTEMPGQQSGKRVLNSIHLSDFQAKVLLLVKTAPTPESALTVLSQQASEIEGNLANAREQMQKLGMLEVTADAITVTPKGEEIMTDEALIDEMGEPTEKGQQIMGTGDQAEIPPQAPPSGEDPALPAGGPAAQEGGGETETTSGFPGESSIFRHVHDLSKLLNG